MENKKSSLLFWSLSIIGILLLTWGMISLANPSQTQEEGQSEISANENIKGNPEATLVVVEYSDFQCPACASYYPLAKQLIEDIGDQVKFIYRHFPLKNIHPNAEIAAYATEAAAMQGKFWEMHDMLFENQSAWSNDNKAKDIFISYAENLELDTEKFTNDLKSDQVKDKVKEDTRNAYLDNVNSTPSFFVNGNKINNPRSYNQFKDAILQFQNQ